MEEGNASDEPDNIADEEANEGLVQVQNVSTPGTNNSDVFQPQQNPQKNKPIAEENQTEISSATRSFQTQTSPQIRPASPTEEMENDELDETSHKRKLFFNCLMAQNISHGDKVHDLIFSYLEIFEILRFKIVNRHASKIVEDYFLHLEYLDLSPFFGFITTEEKLSQPFNISPELNFYEVFEKLSPNRKKLSLAYSKSLHDTALNRFLGPEITGLNLYFCTRLKRRGDCMLGEMLSKIAPNMRDLNVSKINSLSVQTFLSLLRLKNLERLQIVGSLHSHDSFIEPSDAPQNFETEIDYLDKIEKNFFENEFNNLLFIDCRECTLLEKRDFWNWNLKEQDKINRKLYGVYRRQNTWILGPEDVDFSKILQIKCLYCEAVNDKYKRVCEKCSQHLFLHDIMNKKTSFLLGCHEPEFQRFTKEQIVAKGALNHYKAVINKIVN